MALRKMQIHIIATTLNSKSIILKPRQNNEVIVKDDNT